MQQAGWQRFIPFTGVLFVILFIIGFMLGTGPESDKTDKDLLDWYADSGHQNMSIAGAYLLAIAGVAMLLFINRLRGVIAEAEGARPIFAPFILAGGAVFVATLAVAAASFAAVPAGVKFGSEPMPTSADVARFLPQLGYGAVLVLGMFPLIFAIFTTAYASMRLNIFPSWFNWLSVISGIVLFFAALFLPLIALGIWVLAGSWLLMKHQTGAMAAA